MRIGIYDIYLDTLSGGEKYMLTAASCLSGDNEVEIFWDNPLIIEEAYQKLHINLNKVKVVPNIFSPKTSLINRLRETKKYDLLIILSDGSIPLTSAKKTILHFQHPVEWVKSDDFLNRIKLAKIDKIVVNSFYTKKYIDRKFNLDSFVLYPPCINENILQLYKDEKLDKFKKNIILSVGRYNLLPEKDISMKKMEIMITNFKMMVDVGLMNWKLMLVVSYFKENEDKILALEKSATNYPVEIVKNASHEKLEKLYKEAKIYWHAAGFGEDLEKNPERAEHFGITTVESMAHGVVPVVIDLGGQREIVDDGIDGFLWESEEEMRDKTKRLMIDDDLRREMADLGIKKVIKFSNENFCLNLKKILK